MPSSESTEYSRHQKYAKRRLKRQADFEEFKKKAVTLFQVATVEMPGMGYFSAYYNFYVISGDPNVVDGDRIVDFFFGQRAFESTEQTITTKGGVTIKTSFKSEAERGAALHYERLDTGSVLVLLYPAMTKRMRRLEDHILLCEVGEPCRLLSTGMLRRHSFWLAAYMAQTSLDGAINVEAEA